MLDIKVKTVQEILISYPFKVTNVKLIDMSLSYASVGVKQRSRASCVTVFVSDSILRLFYFTPRRLLDITP